MGKPTTRPISMSQTLVRRGKIVRATTNAATASPSPRASGARAPWENGQGDAQPRHGEPVAQGERCTAEPSLGPTDPTAEYEDEQHPREKPIGEPIRADPAAEREQEHQPRGVSR